MLGEMSRRSKIDGIVTAAFTLNQTVIQRFECVSLSRSNKNSAEQLIARLLYVCCNYMFICFLRSLYSQESAFLARGALVTRVTPFVVDTKDTRRAKSYDAISVDHRQCVWDWAFALGNGCVAVGFDDIHSTSRIGDGQN